MGDSTAPPVNDTLQLKLARVLNTLNRITVTYEHLFGDDVHNEPESGDLAGVTELANRLEEAVVDTEIRFSNVATYLGRL